MLKKICVFLAIGCLVLTSFSITSGAGIQQTTLSTGNVETHKETVDTHSEKIHFCRIGPTGATVFEQEVHVKEGETLSQAISAKCRELTSHDEELKEFVTSQFDTELLSSINSYGKGLHLKWKFGVFLYKIIPAPFPLPKIPMVFCKYTNEQAQTLINPLLSEEVQLTGPHSVGVFGLFFGHVGWRLPISILGFFKDDVGFDGFAVGSVYAE